MFEFKIYILIYFLTKFVELLQVLQIQKFDSSLFSVNGPKVRIWWFIVEVVYWSQMWDNVMYFPLFMIIWSGDLKLQMYFCKVITNQIIEGKVLKLCNLFTGYLKIVKSLLLHGATTSLLDSNGALFCLPEFGGVWQEISDHRQRHSNHIFNFIIQDSKKNFAALMKIWLVSL